MDGFRRTALVLIALLPVLMLTGCGGDNDTVDRDSRIAFQTGSPGATSIVTMNGGGSDQQAVISSATDPALSPNGHTIAFARGRDIYAANEDGSAETNLTNHGLGVTASNPAYNPQDTQIAYNLAATVPGATPSIHLMGTDGSNDVEIIAEGTDPTFGPNGSRIVYANGGDLYEANTNGTNITPLTMHAAGTVVGDPSFEPNGNSIVFTYQAPGSMTTSVRRLNLNTSAETTLVADGSEPAYSPFGGNVAFVRDGAINSINTTTLAEQQLTAGPTDAAPSWSRR